MGAGNVTWEIQNLNTEKGGEPRKKYKMTNSEKWGKQSRRDRNEDDISGLPTNRRSGELRHGGEESGNKQVEGAARKGLKWGTEGLSSPACVSKKMKMDLN